MRTKQTARKSEPWRRRQSSYDNEDEVSWHGSSDEQGDELEYDDSVIVRAATARKEDDPLLSALRLPGASAAPHAPTSDPPASLRKGLSELLLSPASAKRKNGLLDLLSRWVQHASHDLEMPLFLAHVLRHDYSTTAFSVATLKADDRKRFDMLQKLCDEAGLHIALAKIEHKARRVVEYGDEYGHDRWGKWGYIPREYRDQIGSHVEINELSCKFGDAVSPDGSSVDVSELYCSLTDVFVPPSLIDGRPGWQRYEGNQLARADSGAFNLFCGHVCVLMWPKNLNNTLLIEGGGREKALDMLRQQLKSCRKRSQDAQARDVLLDLMAAVGQKVDKSNLETLMDCAIFLGSVDLFRRYVPDEEVAKTLAPSDWVRAVKAYGIASMQSSLDMLRTAGELCLEPMCYIDPVIEALLASPCGKVADVKAWSNLEALQSFKGSWTRKHRISEVVQQVTNVGLEAAKPILDEMLQKDIIEILSQQDPRFSSHTYHSSWITMSGKAALDLIEALLDAFPHERTYLHGKIQLLLRQPRWNEGDADLYLRGRKILGCKDFSHGVLSPLMAEQDASTHLVTSLCRRLGEVKDAKEDSKHLLELQAAKISTETEKGDLEAVLTVCSSMHPPAFGLALSKLRPIRQSHLLGIVGDALKLQNELMSYDDIMSEEQRLRREWIRDCVAAALQAWNGCAAKFARVHHRALEPIDSRSVDTFLAAPYRHAFAYKAQEKERKEITRLLKSRYPTELSFETIKTGSPHVLLIRKIGPANPPPGEKLTERLSDEDLIWSASSHSKTSGPCEECDAIREASAANLGRENLKRIINAAGGRTVVNQILATETALIDALDAEIAAGTAVPKKRKKQKDAKEKESKKSKKRSET